MKENGVTNREIAEYFNLRNTKAVKMITQWRKISSVFSNQSVSIDISQKKFDEARQLIDDYMYFYNHERIQLKTKLTPLEKRCQIA